MLDGAGIHNQRKRNINQLLPGTVQAYPTINPNALRPYLGMGIVGLAENSGLSMYNGLQVSLERRFATGLLFGFAYTYSKSMDNGSNLTDVLPNAYDDKDYWGYSDFDRTHVAVLNYIYELPFKGSNGLTRRLLGNWEISGVFQANSGTPFSVRRNNDYAGVGPGSGNQFYDLVGDPSAEVSSFTDSALWFNKDAFRQPAEWHFRQAAAEHSSEPWIPHLGHGTPEELPITEVQKLQFRFEVFNILNHPNWGGANSDPTSGTFGRVTSKSGETEHPAGARRCFLIWSDFVKPQRGGPW